MISTTIMRNQNLISEHVWNTFLKGPGIFDVKKMPENTVKKIVKSDAQFKLLNYLDQKIADQFSGIVKSVLENTASWQKLVTKGDFLHNKLPDDFTEKISDFGKLLLNKVFSPESVLM